MLEIATFVIAATLLHPMGCKLGLTSAMMVQMSRSVGPRGVFAIALPIAFVVSGCVLFDDSDDEDFDEDVGTLPDDPGMPPEPPLQEEPFAGPCLPDAWIDDASDASDVGVPATFAIAGSQVRVVAGPDADVQSIAAPLGLALPGGASVIAFEDATVGELHGTVVVTGSAISAEAGALTGIGDAALWLDDAFVGIEPPAATDDGTRPDLGAAADPAHVQALADAQPVALGIEGLVVTGYDAAYIVTETETVQLVTTITVTASKVYWPAGTTVAASSMTARFTGEVFIGIEPVAGELVADGHRVDELPVAILAIDPWLEVAPDRVETLEETRVRQAMGRDGALVESEVEVRMCQAPTLVFAPGETRALQMAYRQPDGSSDATFLDVGIDEEATGAIWPARLQIDPTLPPELVEPAMAHPSCTWAQSVTEFLEAWVEVTAAITEGVVCVFTFGFVCPDSGASASPPSLAPFPGWMLPSQLGEFQLEVTAPSTPGTYDATLSITGHNYVATMPLHVVVR